MKTKTLIPSLILSILIANAGFARAESAVIAAEEQSMKELLIEQSIAVDQFSIELGNQGIVLTQESKEALQSYSDLLKSESKKTKINPKLKKAFKKVLKGLEKAGLGVVKTASYIGTTGSRILILPILTVSGFTEGLVTGSDPSETLEKVGIVTGVVAAGVMSVPLYFSMPFLIPLTPAMGIVGALPANLLCESDRYMQDEKMDRFCDNMNKIDEILYVAPEEGAFNAGATIHDSVQKLIRKIIRKKASR